MHIFDGFEHQALSIAITALYKASLEQLLGLTFVGGIDIIIPLLSENNLASEAAWGCEV